MWGSWLVYGTALGVGDKVAQAMKSLNVRFPAAQLPVIAHRHFNPIITASRPVRFLFRRAKPRWFPWRGRRWRGAWRRWRTGRRWSRPPLRILLFPPESLFPVPDSGYARCLGS